MSHLILEVGRYGPYLVVTCTCGWGKTIEWYGEYFEGVDYIKSMWGDH